MAEKPSIDEAVSAAYREVTHARPEARINRRTPLGSDLADKIASAAATKLGHEGSIPVWAGMTLENIDGSFAAHLSE